MNSVKVNAPSATRIAHSSHMPKLTLASPVSWSNISRSMRPTAFSTNTIQNTTISSSPSRGHFNAQNMRSRERQALIPGPPWQRSPASGGT